MNQDFDSRVFLIDFFHDFMEFLKLVSQRPMKRTATGNLALSEIAELSKLFRDGHQLIWLDEQMGWKVRNETDCQYLYQIKSAGRNNVFDLQAKGRVSFVETWQRLLNKHNFRYSI